jgi:hypothetical protein
MSFQLMSTHRNGFLAAIIAFVALSSPKAKAGSTDASAVSIIQPGGPRTTDNGTALVDFFFNAEGSSNGSNASYAVADFSGLHLGITSLGQLNSLSLTLTQANAAFTTNGTFGVYLSTDTTTNIGLGSPLTFQTTSSPTGLGTQLNNALGNSLGTSFAFVEVANGHQGVLDLLPFVSGLSAGSQSFRPTGGTRTGAGAWCRRGSCPGDVMDRHRGPLSVPHRRNGHGVMGRRRSALSVPQLTSMNDHVTTADAPAIDLSGMLGPSSKHAPKR